MKSGNSKERMWNVSKVHKPSYAKVHMRWEAGSKCYAEGHLADCRTTTSKSLSYSINLSVYCILISIQPNCYFSHFLQNLFLTTLPLPATVFFSLLPFAAKLWDWSVLTVPTPLLYSFPSITPLKSIHQSQRWLPCCWIQYSMCFFFVCSFEVSAGFDIVYHSLLIGTISSLGSYTFPVFLLPQWLLQLRFPCCLLHTNMVS